MENWSQTNPEPEAKKYMNVMESLKKSEFVKEIVTKEISNKVLKPEDQDVKKIVEILDEKFLENKIEKVSKIENMRMAGKISKEEKRILDSEIEERVEGDVVQVNEEEVFKNLKNKFYEMKLEHNRDQVFNEKKEE